MPTHHVDLYLITALSNLHAGKGDSNYGIVDNEVQRDPVQGLPVIFSSSLKGSLRELFERRLKLQGSIVAQAESVITQAQIVTIFGNDVKNNSGLIQSGKYVFHEARLLSLPVRADNRPFFHATTPNIFKELKEYFKLMVSGEKQWVKALDELDKAIKDTNKNLENQPWGVDAGMVDEYKAQLLPADVKTKLTALMNLGLWEEGAPLALFFDKKFKEICERLPVIARNQLENGVSQNLFYEEVVPRQTRFTFFVERPADNDVLNEHLEGIFNNRLQIGANASIGYGVSGIKRIFTTQNSEKN